MSTTIDALSVVILTHNRTAELCRTIDHVRALPERPSIVVVDNASIDATTSIVRARFPDVKLLSLKRNIGAAARNLGVQAVETRYVAFCDDDTWWEPGALSEAVALLDAHPDLAILSARVLVGPGESEDPTCTAMASSPLPRGNLPGPALLGFLAGAAVIRRRAFLEVGGYEPKFFIGGEESLLALDLAARGWRLAYASQLTVHHYPCLQRDANGRNKFLIRNALWVAWMRLPWPMLARQSYRTLRSAYRARVLIAGLFGALGELGWVIRRRSVIPPEVERLFRLLTDELSPPRRRRND